MKYSEYVYCFKCFCFLKIPQKDSGPLTGVVICVGKKLSKMQSELNAIAASLGADFRYLAVIGNLL